MLSILNKLCGRTNAFTFLFYPKSEEDKQFLFDFLANIKVPSCVGPLHDQDINEINVNSGEVEFKDPHFHVVIDYGSGQNKTVSQMFDLIQPIRKFVGIAPLDRLTEDDSEIKVSAAVKVWKNENCVKNMRSLLRYFKHLDNPEKHQYLTEDYHSFCGFDISSRVFSETDSIQITKDIRHFIKNNECYLFCDLVDYSEENFPEWYSVLTNAKYSGFIISYMRSLAYKASGKLDNMLDS